jgi:hypothetical protein
MRIIPMNSEFYSDSQSTAWLLPLLLLTIVLLGVSFSIFPERGFAQWVPVNNGLKTLWASSIAADDGGRVYANFFGTLYMSENGGDFWQILREELDDGPIHVVSRGNLVVGGIEVTYWPGYSTTTHYALHSADNGQTWQSLPSGGINQFVHDRAGHIAFRHSDQYGVDSRVDGVSVSSDSGRTWIDTLFFSPNNSAYGKKGLSAIALLSDGSILLGVVNPWYQYDFHTYIPPTPGIYRSSLHGDNWSLICDSLVVTALAVDSTDIWIASASLLRDSAETSPGVYRSTDMGATWIHVFDSLFTSFHAIGKGTIVASTENVSFLTSDRGSTWMELPKRFVVSGVTRQGTIFALYDNTPYRSTDAGQSWQEVSEGLSGKKVSMLAVAPDGDVYASVSGFGIFKLAKPASVESNSSTIAEPINITLTPNPVAGETVMAGLDLSGSATIAITITDILGHTVVAERELRLAGGRNQIPLKLHRLPSGSYFVRVSIGERTMSHILIRP